MVLSPWNKYVFSEKSNLVLGNRLSENRYFNRGENSQGNMPGWIVFNDTSIQSDLISRNEQARIHNRCVAKVVDKAQVVENYFEAIYERREALQLAATAASKLLDFLVNFRKPKYWKSFGKPKPKDLPEAWLTYNFGVAPLVATIDSAMKLLGKPYPSIVLKGASGMPVNATNIYDWAYFKDVQTARGTYFKEIRAYVSPENNPNYALSNVMGLSTPFSTAFSVIPWGWAVDYFVNCSDLMSNFEDRFPGIRFDSVWESVSVKVEHSFVRYEKFSNTVDSMNYGNAYNTYRQPSSLQYQLEFSFPLLGGRQFANLASAIALTLKGKH